MLKSQIKNSTTYLNHNRNIDALKWHLLVIYVSKPAHFPFQHLVFADPAILERKPSGGNFSTNFYQIFDKFLSLRKIGMDFVKFKLIFLNLCEKLYSFQIY